MPSKPVRHTQPGEVEMKQTRINFGISPDLKADAIKEAQRQEVPLSVLMRRALEFYLITDRTPR